MKHFFARVTQLPALGGTSGIAKAALGLLLGLVWPMAAWAQAPAWQSAVSLNGAAGSVSTVTVSGSAPDAGGNLYLAGTISGSVTFGGTVLVAQGGSDAFVAKWNSTSRAFVWAKRAGGSGYDNGSAVAVIGNAVYLGGDCQLGGTFDGVTLPSTTPNNSDGFVARLTDAGSTGTFAWVARAGNGVNALAATGQEVYVGGQYVNSVTLGSTSLTGLGGNDALLAKFADAGSAPTWRWAQALRGAGNDRLRSVVVRGSNVYGAGTFVSNSLSVGSTTLTNTDTRGLYADGFVVKYTDTGSGSTLGWVEQLGGTDGSNEALALAAHSGGVYVAGQFSSTQATFGTQTLSNNSSSGASSDGFVAKLTDAGATASYNWAQRLGGSNSETINALAVNGTKVFAAGNFFGSNVAIGPSRLTSAGSFDVLLVGLTDAGASVSVDWGQRAGGPGDDGAKVLSLVGSTLCVGGSYGSPATFGTVTLTAPGTGTPGYLATLDAGPLAIGPALAARQWRIWPNPAHTQATVELPALAGSPCALTLTDALGRVVRSAVVPAALAGTSYPLDLTGLAPGLYLLRLRGGDTPLTRRLVVE